MKRLSFRTVIVAVALTSGMMLSPASGAELGGLDGTTGLANQPDVHLDVLGNFDDGVISPAELVDLERLADVRGITLDEAISRHAWQQPFAFWVAEYRHGMRDEYSGAAIRPDGTAWIAFKGAAPEGVGAEALRFGGRVEVVENRGFSQHEANERMMRTHYATFDQSDLVSDVSSGFDPETGRITMMVRPVDPDDAVLVDRLGQRVDLSANVDVVVLDADLSGNDTIYGGGELTTCTGGFNLIKNGTKNVSTAAHCGNSQTYEGTVTLTFRKEHEGTWGDVQRHSAFGQGQGLWDDFYWIEGITRDVCCIGTEVVGQDIWRFGKTTGAELNRVYQLLHCDGPVCHLTIFEDRLADGGDSGGPWYWGNVAYGIHHGWKHWLWPWERDAMMPAHYIDDALPGWVVYN